MRKVKKTRIPRSFGLTMSMRTYNDLMQVFAHVEETTRGDLRRRAAMARQRLERALHRAAR